MVGANGFEPSTSWSRTGESENLKPCGCRTYKPHYAKNPASIGPQSKYRVLFALSAGTGLRIGEALALRSTDFGPDCRVLHVRRSLWRGREQEPKTSNAVRVVDISEVLASEVRGYISSVNGYLFATVQGKPLQQRNVLRILHSVKRVGFHAFRRFRVSRGSKRAVRRRTWNAFGWATHPRRSVTSTQSEDVAFRQERAERIGLGFELVHNGPQNAEPAEAEKVA